MWERDERVSGKKRHRCIWIYHVKVSHRIGIHLKWYARNNNNKNKPTIPMIRDKKELQQQHILNVCGPIWTCILCVRFVSVIFHFQMSPFSCRIRPICLLLFYVVLLACFLREWCYIWVSLHVIEIIQ